MCIHYLKAAWSENLKGRLHGAAGPLHRRRGPTEEPATPHGPSAAPVAGTAGKKAWWTAVKRCIQRQDGDYCRVELEGGQALVVATVPFDGSAPIPAADAAREVVAAVAAVPLVQTAVRRKQAGKRVAHRPVSTSYGWALPEARSGQWRRVGAFVEMERSIEVMREMGVQVKADDTGVVNDPGVRRRYFCLYPVEWTDDHIEFAAVWAAAQTVPPGWIDGALPPDPKPYIDLLVEMIAELPQPDPCFDPAPTPATAPWGGATDSARRAPTPPPQRPLGFMIQHVVETDPAGRWRIVERGPEGVFRWSRRAYRTYQAADEALQAGRYRLAPEGVYSSRVAFVPDSP